MSAEAGAGAVVRRARVPARDGLKLAAVVYRAGSQPPVGSIVIAGAVGVRQARYAWLASFLAELGWVVVTFDYRGIGASVVPRPDYGSVSMQLWADEDLEGVLGWVNREFAAPRRVALGHSIGGQLLGLTEAQSTLDAVALVAAQKGYWRLWPDWRRYAVYGFFKWFVPVAVSRLGYLPLARMGLDDLPPAAAHDWARWGLHDDYLDARSSSQFRRFERVKMPMLALSAADDRNYAPRPAVDRLLSHYYENAPSVHCHVEPERFGLPRLGHSGFFEHQALSSLWWRELSNWLLGASSSNLLAGFEPAHPCSLRHAVVAHPAREASERDVPSRLEAGARRVRVVTTE
jgi:predicted alpha/beta hydrolase